MIKISITYIDDFFIHFLLAFSGRWKKRFYLKNVNVFYLDLIFLERRRKKHAKMKIENLFSKNLLCRNYFFD